METRKGYLIENEIRDMLPLGKSAIVPENTLFVCFQPFQRKFKALDVLDLSKCSIFKNETSTVQAIDGY